MSHTHLAFWHSTSQGLKSVFCSFLDSNSPSVRFSKSCLKNVFSVILLFIYLLLMAVAVFLVYQTITDFREKLKHPVMSVSYKEVPSYDAPGKIELRAGERIREHLKEVAV